MVQTGRGTSATALGRAGQVLWRQVLWRQVHGAHARLAGGRGGAFLQRAPPSTVVPDPPQTAARRLVGGHQSTAVARQVGASAGWLGGGCRVGAGGRRAVMASRCKPIASAWTARKHRRLRAPARCYNNRLPFCDSLPRRHHLTSQQLTSNHHAADPAAARGIAVGRCRRCNPPACFVNALQH